jgi:hypothetical protein
MTVIRSLFLLLLLSSVAKASDVWLSSYTVTADSATICGGGKRGFFHGYCTTVTGSGVFKVYNSSFTGAFLTQVIESETNGSLGCKTFDIVAPNGLFYVKTTLAEITMLYDCK